MSRIKRSVVLSFAVAGAFGAVAENARAELEEIVVTARKTEEALTAAPVAVSAFTAKTIEQQGIKSIDDLAKYTPGLSFSQAFGRTTDRPVIRGQSNVLAGVQFGVESGTAYFVDGVYFPGDIQGLDLNALERVEVIKGPQSALYGRNTYAGAINFITRAPGKELEANAGVNVAEHDSHEYTFGIGGSIFDDTLGLRLYGRDYQYGGEYENQLTGKLVGQESTKSVGLNAVWQPVADLKVNANVIRRWDNDGSPALFLQGASANNCYPGYRSAAYRSVAPGSNPYQYYCGVIAPGIVQLNTEPLPVTVAPSLGPLFGPLFGTGTKVRDGTAFDGVDTDETFGSLRLDYDIAESGWVVTSMSGYRDYANRFGTDSDHSNAFTLLPSYRPGPNPNLSGGQYGYADPGSPQEKEPLFANTNRDNIVSKSTELRLASPQDKRLRGMVGYYWYDFVDRNYDLTLQQPVQGPHSFTETIEDRAFFGLLSFDFTDQLTLTVEARHMEETKGRQEFCSTDSGDYNQWTDSCTNLGTFRANFTQYFADAADYYNVDFGLKRYDREKKYTATTPRVTLDWKVTPDTMLYAVYAEGVKPGGINGSAGAAVGRETYDQEKSKNLELGTKITMFDNRARFSGALYYTDSTDVQFTQALANPAGTAITSIATNQGAGKIYGAEFELTAAISDAVTLSAGYAYTHSEITRGCDDFEYVLRSGGIVYNANDPNAPELCDISGNRYPLGPEQTASLSFNYDAPTGFGTGLRWIGNFGMTYEGSKYVQVHNLAQTGETTLVNARFGIASDDGWSVVFYGKNLTDADTIPLATRWFDLRTGSARFCNGTSITANCIPASLNPGLTVRPGFADTGSPRAFFGALRPGRQFGLELKYNFKL